MRSVCTSLLPKTGVPTRPGPRAAARHDSRPASRPGLSSGGGVTAGARPNWRRPAPERLVQQRAAQTDVGVSADSQSGAKTVQYTSYEGNSWSMVFPSGVSMLVDPWLVGDLTFANQTWLYEGSKSVPLPSLEEVEAATDFVLISQGLDDHAHIPTLEKLSKDLPVVASPSAAEICLRLGFKRVHSLQAGERCTLCDGRISVRATEGALVGPPWATREAGFVVKERLHGGITVYYEPHCDFVESSIRPHAPLDVVVSPVIDIKLGGFPLVMGYDNLLDLLRTLQPSVLIPLKNGSFNSKGPLSEGMSSTGTFQEVPDRLSASGLGHVKMADVEPGVPVSIQL